MLSAAALQYDTRCYFYVRSKPDTHTVPTTKKVGKKEKLQSKKKRTRSEESVNSPENPRSKSCDAGFYPAAVSTVLLVSIAFGALTLLVGRQEGHLAFKKTEWWGAGMAICLERGADLHMAQLMPLPLNVSCFSKIHIGFTFLIWADPGSPGLRAVTRVCVCVCVCVY